jgi:tryptophan synthase alpha chain
MTSAVTTAFGKAAADGRAALVGYLPAGFPSVDGAIEAARVMAAAGADVIEVGLPYSDPLMDGPVIAEAVMTYWNPVDRYGVRAFARDLAAAGGSGLITPDLTIEEAGSWLDAASEHDLDRVFLVAPSSTGERIATVTRACRGFVYAASLMGTTGARDAVSGDAAGLVARTREHTRLPVAVGLGVSTGPQAAQVAAFADGVIVGSAFVRRLLDADNSAAAAQAITDLTAELAAGVRRPAPEDPPRA